MVFSLLRGMKAGFIPLRRDETRFHPSNLSAETIEISTHKGDDAMLVSSSISCVIIIIIIGNHPRDEDERGYSSLCRVLNLV